MNHHTHLTTDDRETAMVMLSKGYSLRKIALKLQRAPSTIAREVRRNVKPNGEYSSTYALKQYNKRKKHCGAKPKLNIPDVAEYIIQRLEKLWTPEQISARAKLERKPFCFSYVTIYRAIDSGVLPKQLKKTMRFKCKYKTHKTNDKRGRTQDTVSIHERPQYVQNRKSIGHWESDTVLGTRKTGCIGTHVERKSGFLIAFYLPNLQGKSFDKATVAAFENIVPKYKKTLTVDNGSEFMYHKELSANTNMKIFFCDPFSPWQRGTNENTNGLLRQFYPKKTSFASITKDQLDEVVCLINNRPRKRLGFLTPAEVFFKNYFR